jgi:hypothetical protein
VAGGGSREQLASSWHPPLGAFAISSASSVQQSAPEQQVGQIELARQLLLPAACLLQAWRPLAPGSLEKYAEYRAPEQM